MQYSLITGKAYVCGDRAILEISVPYAHFAVN